MTIANASANPGFPDRAETSIVTRLDDLKIYSLTILFIIKSIAVMRRASIHPRLPGKTMQHQERNPHQNTHSLVNYYYVCNTLTFKH